MITIVSLLLALLMPAVQSAREAARRAMCVNNLKQIALATHGYHGVYRVFPVGGFGSAWGGWPFEILPFLEANTAAERCYVTNMYNEQPGGGDPLHNGNFLARGNMLTAPNVAAVTGRKFSLYTCPSAVPKERFGTIPLDAYGGSGKLDVTIYHHNYVANCGNTAVVNTFIGSGAAPTVTFGGHTATFGGAPFQVGGHGLKCVHDNQPMGLSNVLPAKVSCIDAVTDGLSNTLLFSEAISVPDSVDLWSVFTDTAPAYDLRGCIWLNAFNHFETLLTPNSRLPDQVDYPGWCISTARAPCFGMATTTLDPNDLYALEFSAARSYHPGGVNTAWADGSVHFCSDDVAWEVWQALGTSRGEDVLAASD